MRRLGKWGRGWRGGNARRVVTAMDGTGVTWRLCDEVKLIGFEFRGTLLTPVSPGTGLQWESIELQAPSSLVVCVVHINVPAKISVHLSIS